jgi:hypothetical protein
MNQNIDRIQTHPKISWRGCKYSACVEQNISGLSRVERNISGLSRVERNISGLSRLCTIK